MIDTSLRSRGIGGSDIAAICGLDSRRDRFSVWAEKRGIAPPIVPTARMAWGKRIERVIAEAYSAETGREVAWSDETVAHRERLWQVATPDAFVIESGPVGGLDAKNIAWDQAARWGDPGTDDVPQAIYLQCLWYCSALELPWWDVAGLFGGHDLRIYRVSRDAEIESAILDEAGRFWVDHVVSGDPPAPGGTARSAEIIASLFPRAGQIMRPATEEEAGLMAALRAASARRKTAALEEEAAKQAVQLAIGDDLGLADIAGHRVRWNSVPAARVEAYDRAAYRRLTIS